MRTVGLPSSHLSGTSSSGYLAALPRRTWPAALKISAAGSSGSPPSPSSRPTIGVLGGASPATTVSFLKNLVRLSSERVDVEEEEDEDDDDDDGGKRDHLPFIVCSDPELSRKLSSRPLRSRRKESLPDVDGDAIVEGLRQKRQLLESSGARCIVMPCHVSTFWHTQVSEGCSVPFLDMGQCIADELSSAALRPVEAGSNIRIGILATGSPLTAAIYREKILHLGYEAVVPDQATEEHAVAPALEALTKGDVEGARMLLRISLHVLLVKAVNVIILASDDLRGLLPKDDPLLRRCVDPVDTLARSTVDWARSYRGL